MSYELEAMSDEQKLAVGAHYSCSLLIVHRSLLYISFLLTISNAMVEAKRRMCLRSPG